MSEETESAARLLALVEWAVERYENTQRIAATKHGADRIGWLEDGEYWQAIVAVLVEQVRTITMVATADSDHNNGRHDSPDRFL